MKRRKKRVDEIDQLKANEAACESESMARDAESGGERITSGTHPIVFKYNFILIKGFSSRS